MANGSASNNWERIQMGLKGTERLIGQGDYNSAMIKARQTVEFMVKTLTERSGSMNDGDLMEMIDLLYQNRRITKTTCDRYHKIRMMGNKAAHEGDNSPSNGNLAFQMLAQEVRTFSSEYRNKNRSYKKRSSRSSSSRNSRRRSGRRRSMFTPVDFLKLLGPIICILLIFWAVKSFKPKPDEADSSASDTLAVETTTGNTMETMETLPPEPTETETPATVYRTTDVLNVRAEPRTDATKLGQLVAGATVEYVRAENDEWAVILFNGQEAYVASQYLKEQ